MKAKKNLGQNFLKDKTVLNTIGDYFDIKNKNILEVGPGLGDLTEIILEKKPKNLTLVEIDKDLIKGLENKFSTKTKIINEDILKYEPDFENYYVIANIPYYITSPILYHFIYKTKIKSEKMIIMMQKEVGEKILGNSKEKSSVLNLLCTKKYKIEKVCLVGPDSFIPAPKVWSIVLSFELKEEINSNNDENFEKLIKIGFKNPRKKLIKNPEEIINKEKILELLESIGKNENTRGEELSLNDWLFLEKNLKITNKIKT